MRPRPPKYPTEIVQIPGVIWRGKEYSLREYNMLVKIGNQRKITFTGTHHEKLTCPVCGFEGRGPIMYRWHFEKCRKDDKKKET